MKTTILTVAAFFLLSTVVTAQAPASCLDNPAQLGRGSQRTSKLPATSTPERRNTVKIRPNVLFIVVDDLNCRVGCYGDTLVHTPHIDRLAQRGVLFERAYAQYPVCNPSRCSFLSGRRPESIDILDNSEGIRTKHPDVVTLPQCFRNAGWYTAGIAKVFHVDQWDPPHPEDRPGSWRRDDPLAWDFRLNTKPTETGKQGDRMELAGKVISAGYTQLSTHGRWSRRRPGRRSGGARRVNLTRLRRGLFLLQGCLLSCPARR